MSNLHMLAPASPLYLIATADAGLLLRIEPQLAESGVELKIARSSDAMFDFVKSPSRPDLLLLDSKLPGMSLEQILRKLREDSGFLPVVLIADKFSDQLRSWLREELATDLILQNLPPAYWELRTRNALRLRRLVAEAGQLREAAAHDAQHDRLTGVLNRDAILAELLRESDRVQRSKDTLTLVLFDIDDFGHWNSRLGVNTCDDLLRQVAARTERMLRSYDLLGRTSKDEFLLGLPGCSETNAALIAQRVQAEVFAQPYHVAGEVIRLSACFGIAQSLGRSPVIVLREAEQALACARKNGPESIECAPSAKTPSPPVTFLLPSTGEELLVW